MFQSAFFQKSKQPCAIKLENNFSECRVKSSPAMLLLEEGMENMQLVRVCV